MTLGEKLRQLRALESAARGLQRDFTQSDLSQSIEKELGGKVSQSYISQIEKGQRRHLTHTTRTLLARFFHVHPGYLVDDPETPVSLTSRKRLAIDEQLDHWLIDGGEEFATDPELSRALNTIAQHENSRACLLLLAEIVRNRQLLDRLIAVPAANRRTPAPP